MIHLIITDISHMRHNDMCKGCIFDYVRFWGFVGFKSKKPYCCLRRGMVGVNNTLFTCAFGFEFQKHIPLKTKKSIIYFRMTFNKNKSEIHYNIIKICRNSFYNLF